MNHKNTPSSFVAFNLSLALIRALRPLISHLTKHDRNLEKQLRAAASSVALNLSEGRKRRGRDRLHFWRIAAGSAEESRACLHVAVAWGYIDESEAVQALDFLDQVLAICWRLTEK